MINQNLNIDLIQIIENEIKYNNSIFCKVDLPFCKDLPVFKIEDFDYIFSYANKYNKDIEVRKFITYCVANIWKDLSELEISTKLWWDDSNFLNLLFKRICEISDSYFILLENNKNQDALTIFRSYVELISTLFACLLDKEFYFNYIMDIDDAENYKKHWYQKLKPEQVKKSIKNINTEQQLPSSYYCDYAKKTFTGDQREIIYPYVSSICHGKFSHIKNNDLNKENELITYATDYLVHSMVIIQQLSYNYCNYENSIMERKHQIVMGIWIKILYDHILGQVE